MTLAFRLQGKREATKAFVQGESTCAAYAPCFTCPSPINCRGDLVSIETYFQRDSRIAFERNWIIKNAATGVQLGVATRCEPRQTNC